MLLQKRVYRFKEGIHVCTNARGKAEYETELVVLIIILSGTAEITSGDQFFSLESSSVLLFKPKKKIKVENAGGNELIYDLFLFSCYQLTAITEEELRYRKSSDLYPEDGIMYNQVSAEVKSVASQLIHIWTKEAESSKVIYVLNHLISKIEEEVISFHQRTYHSSFHSVLQYIQLHSHQALSRDTVARHFGYHPNYFSDRLKKETGWSFSDYLSQIRMEKAKVYLLEHTLTIGEVARKVGYQDGLYLSRKFRKQTGMSPSEFRKGEKQ